MDLQPWARQLSSGLAQLHELDKSVTMLQLVDVWRGVGKLRVHGLDKPPSGWGRHLCCAALCQMLAAGALRESFRHTAYSTTAYMACAAARLGSAPPEQLQLRVPVAVQGKAKGGKGKGKAKGGKGKGKAKGKGKGKAGKGKGKRKAALARRERDDDGEGSDTDSDSDFEAFNAGSRGRGEGGGGAQRKSKKRGRAVPAAQAQAREQKQQRVGDATAVGGGHVAIDLT